MTTKPLKPLLADGPHSKSDQTRAVIIAAAARQFRYDGYSASTMRKIAETAEMEAGSIYYHFESKEEILNEVLDLGLRCLYEKTSETLEEIKELKRDFGQILTKLFNTHLTFLLTESDFTSANIRNFSTLPKYLRKKHSPLRLAYSILWDDFLKEAQNEGCIRTDIGVAPLRQFILGAINWTVEWYDTDRYPVSDLADRMAKLLMDGMATSNDKPLAFLPAGPDRDHDTTPTASKKAAKTKAKVLSAAARIVRDRGYKAATMRAIAQEAGIEAGSVYYHFPSKEDILDKVLDLGIRDLLDGVKQTISDENTYPDDLSKIAAAIETHMEVLFQRSEFTSANIRIYGQLPADVRARHWPVRHEYAKLWDGILADAQKSGSIRSDIKIVPLRQVMLGALNWTVEWFDCEKGGQDNYYTLQQLIGVLQKLLLGGILK